MAVCNTFRNLRQSILKKNNLAEITYLPTYFLYLYFANLRKKRAGTFKLTAMKLRVILLLAFFAVTAPASFAQVKQKSAKTEQPRQHRIVYDVNAADTAQHAGLMRQLNNLKRAWPDARVEVVVYGKALNLLVTENTTKATAIKELQAKGVVFAACENTMRARKITKAQLLPAVITVPMAVGEIVIKQEEGWSYIKL